MKFKNYLASIDDVSIYPLVSLILFTVFFCGVIIYVFRMKKSKSEDFARIPLK
ncbi:MAG: cbb3-type cytochrome c oxidase subunit 3 [Saprospiraceae bacterium]|nr:cbb3-type cytochrome c oxidase subunit 3 [Saprospiraceae bacterium]MBK7812298.1 cbb3-type cytochrome c oxidase subunit 3 [Saprospiraceae bacterium]MBK9632481.1 cbb3-type cytochrome c oxidase subunit 3 [Saprospiraceae bacterium]